MVFSKSVYIPIYAAAATMMLIVTTQQFKRRYLELKGTVVNRIHLSRDIRDKDGYLLNIMHKFSDCRENENKKVSI